jgi:hypothetical protein
MKAELPLMLRLAGDAAFNAADDDLYSDGVLTWWRTHGKAIPAWQVAARIVFALTPNSASCERVFAAGNVRRHPEVRARGSASSCADDALQ